MIFSLSHSMRYTYSENVFLQPHILRMHPRSNHRQHVLDFSLEISPTPKVIWPYAAIDDSIAHHVQFEGATDYLYVKTTIKLETLPMYFLGQEQLVFPNTHTLPIVYPHQKLSGLGPFLSSNIQVEALQVLVQDVLDRAKNRTLPFLDLLTQTLHERIEKEYREFGWPNAPEETLKRGKGSCRDVAVLWMALARSVGLAVRFVSGYVYDPDLATHSELHAWPQVMLPGIGWEGFDPSYGRRVDARYVEVCANGVPQLCAPLEGAYAGASSQRLETEVQLLELY